jgi:ABC-type uncharacterized transport system substrate-binding protein
MHHTRPRPARNGSAHQLSRPPRHVETHQQTTLGGAHRTLPIVAAELVALPVHVIYASGTPAARVAKTASLKATPAVRVVFAMASDPVTEGFVESLNRPGGNITGVTSIAGALAPKRLDFVREFLRDGDAVAILLNRSMRSAKASRGRPNSQLELSVSGSKS